MEKYFHSVRLIDELCKGCTNCVRRCPTEAIRVRFGKAIIINDRCIDCGECIRICPHGAKVSVVSPADSIEKFEYKIALPAPSLYAQFNTLENVDVVLAALKDFGFDMVYEVSQAAEYLSLSTRLHLKEDGIAKPIISSACPAVLRLISVRFPQLIENILPYKSPLAVAGYEAKRIAMEKTGLPPEKIGTVFITPCPAKVTAVKSAIFDDCETVDEVISIRDIYANLVNIMNKGEIKNTAAGSSGSVGIGWAGSGGECYGLGIDEYLAADGMENVIRVLEDLEDDKLHNLSFVELNACPGGCVGGVLTVENPFIAITKLKKLRKPLPDMLNTIEDEVPSSVPTVKKIKYLPIMRLDENIVVASQKLKMLREIEIGLYGLDCGACGAPSCRSLAEDIVRGYATEDYCVYKMAEKTAGDKSYPINPLPIAFQSKEALDNIILRKGAEKNVDK